MQYTSSEIKKEKNVQRVRELMKRVRELRIELGLSAEEFACFAGLKGNIYRLLENNGSGHLCSLHLTLSILAKWGANINSLLLGEKEILEEKKKEELRLYFASKRKTKKQKMNEIRDYLDFAAD